MLHIYKSEDRNECKRRVSQTRGKESKLVQWSQGCSWHDTGWIYTGYNPAFSTNCKPIQFSNNRYSWISSPFGYCYPPNTGNEYHKHHWIYAGRKSTPVYNLWLNIGKVCQFDIQDLCSIDLPTGWCVAIPYQLTYRIPIATHTRYLSHHRVMRTI